MSLRHAIAAITLTAAAGCAGPESSSWNAPLGSQLDPGYFGNATMNNMMVQSGRITQVEGLNNRFSTEVDTMVNFDFDSAVLSPQARATIARQASWIRQFPEATFRVYGHTDLVGSEAYNQALGQRRAEAVVAELVRNGANPARLTALVSFGETQPLIVTQGRERANRRTITEVSGFAGHSGDLMYGKYAEIIVREYIQSATYEPRLDREAGPAGGALGGLGATP